MRRVSLGQFVRPRAGPLRNQRLQVLEIDRLDDVLWLLTPAGDVEVYGICEVR